MVQSQYVQIWISMSITSDVHFNIKEKQIKKPVAIFEGRELLEAGWSLPKYLSPFSNGTILSRKLHHILCVTLPLGSKAKSILPK